MFRVVQNDGLAAMFVEVFVKLERGKLTALAIVDRGCPGGSLDALRLCQARTPHDPEKRVDATAEIFEVALELGVRSEVTGTAGNCWHSHDGYSLRLETRTVALVQL
jgi:hypothetical protein